MRLRGHNAVERQDEAHRSAAGTGDSGGSGGGDRVELSTEATRHDRSRLRRWTTDLVVVCGSAAISFGFFGWRLLPHPGRHLIGFGHDAQIYIWSFAWWSHAIGSWANPFYTHSLYAPDGVNLAWT